MPDFTYTATSALKKAKEFDHARKLNTTFPARKKKTEKSCGTHCTLKSLAFYEDNIYLFITSPGNFHFHKFVKF